jgi:hypothetical protein
MIQQATNNGNTNNGNTNNNNSKKLVILPDTGLVTLMSQEEYLEYLDSIYDR